MGATTTIDWTDATINFWWGCEKIAAGCANCYAEKWSKRWGLKLWGPGSVRKRIKGAIPLARQLNARAKREGIRLKVFSNSMSDFFESFDGKIVDEKANHIGDGLDVLRKEAFDVIDSTPYLDWQLLTKRPENIRTMWPEVLENKRWDDRPFLYHWDEQPELYRGNVWLGTSVSEQRDVDNIFDLVQCRNIVPVLFVSAEPLTGPVDLTRVATNSPFHSSFNPLTGHLAGEDPNVYEGEDGYDEEEYYERGEFGIDWVIVGGESGDKVRECRLNWIAKIITDCRAFEVSCFVKQLGKKLRHGGIIHGWPQYVTAMANGAQELLGLRDDVKGGDWSEWPEELRVREFPAAKAAAGV